MITFAKDKATARISGEFYVNAINVMRGASSVSKYVGLAEQEAFNIEYWLLEEAKLQRMPKPKSLAGRVALITGGAGGIGSAIAARLMGEGACVVLADIDRRQPRGARRRIRQALRQGRRRRRRDGRHQRGERRGGGSRERWSASAALDIVVCNAGIASAAAFEDTSLELWNRNIVDPRHRLFPLRPRRLSHAEATGVRRRDRVHRLEERDGGLGRRLGLLRGQGGGGASGALPGAGRRAARHPRQHRQSRRRAARLENLGGRMAPAARRLQQGRRGRAGGGLPPALAAEAVGLSRGHRRGRLFLRLAICRRNRPATSSTSTPATRRRSRDEREASAWPTAFPTR